MYCNSACLNFQLDKQDQETDQQDQETDQQDQETDQQDQETVVDTSDETTIMKIDGNNHHKMFQ